MANPKSKEKKISVLLFACDRPPIHFTPPSLTITKKKRIRIPYIWTDARFPNWFRSHTKRRRTENEKKKTRVGVKCHRTHFAAASVPPPLQFMCSIREIQVPPYLYFFPFLSSSEGGDALMWLMAIAPPRATSSMRRRRKRRDSGVSSNKYTTATPRIAVREMYMRTHF